MSDQIEGLPANRLISLDVFRGITIAGMILVNNPGTWSHVYPPLLHADWHGWTPTDFIFPFFLFIMGVAMVYSFTKVKERGAGMTTLHLKILRRTVILFLLGVLIQLIPIDFPAGYNWFRDTFAQVRIMGVLQRIALVYLAASLIVLHTSRRTQFFIGAGLLLGYWALMKLVPFPVMMNGTAVTHIGTLDKEINLAAYVDDLLLHGHTWVKGTYFHHDPEGLLSTLPAIVTCLFGVFTGYWLQEAKDEQKSGYEIVAGLFFFGLVCVVIGQVWHFWFPINKPIWTSSYVVFTGGMALLFLAMCYYLIDIKQVSGWSKPFVIFGTNALAFYVLAAVVTRLTLMIRVGAENVRLKTWIYEHAYASWLSDINASLAYALVYILFWLMVMSLFYRNRIFIKL